MVFIEGVYRGGLPNVTPQPSKHPCDALSLSGPWLLILCGQSAAFCLLTNISHISVLTDDFHVWRGFGYPRAEVGI